MGQVIVPAALDVRGAVVGQVIGEDGGGLPLVTWPGGSGTPREAEVLRPSEPTDWGACRGLRCLLVFPSGSAGGPVLLGLLDTPPEGAVRGAESSVPGSAGARAPDYLRLEGNRELILQCGQAKISLRADGRIVILGGYVDRKSVV